MAEPSTKRRRTGMKQTLAAMESPSANMAEPSTKRPQTGRMKQRLAAMARRNFGAVWKRCFFRLCKFFAEKAWGFLSPQDLQEYSAKACREFQTLQTEPPSDLDLLANSGTKVF